MNQIHKKIGVVFGTHPEAIKRVPVVKALWRAGTFDVRLPISDNPP